jgi:hypothetical protein
MTGDSPTAGGITPEATPELRRRLAVLGDVLTRTGGFDARAFRTWLPIDGALVEVPVPPTSSSTEKSDQHAD